MTYRILIAFLLSTSSVFAAEPLPVISQAEYEILTAQQQSAYVSDFKMNWLQFASAVQSAASAPQVVRRSSHYNRPNWTPKQYGQTIADANGAYLATCQGNENKAACATLLKDIVATTPESACKVIATGTDGHRIQIPKVGFTKEYRCAFQANAPLLRKVAENGCAKTDPKTTPANDLFITKFEASSGISLLGPTNIFEGIIEDVQEQDGHYIVQMLKPNMTKKPVTLERVSFVLRKVGGIYMLRLPTGTEVQVKIENTPRKNLVPSVVSVKGRQNHTKEENAQLDRFYDAHVLLASNCELSKGLKSLNVYQSSPSSALPKAAR